MKTKRPSAAKQRVPLWATELKQHNEHLNDPFVREQFANFALRLHEDIDERINVSWQYRRYMRLWRRGAKDPSVFLNRELQPDAFLMEAAIVLEELEELGDTWLAPFLDEVQKIADQTRLVRQRIYNANIMDHVVQTVEDGEHLLLSPEVRRYIDLVLDPGAYDN